MPMGVYTHTTSNGQGASHVHAFRLELTDEASLSLRNTTFS